VKYTQAEIASVRLNGVGTVWHGQCYYEPQPGGQQHSCSKV
jgi:hypothetical protein